MRKFIRRLATGIVVALALIGMVTVATPGVSLAECENGWWNPLANMCEPLPPVCENGWVVNPGGKWGGATTSGMRERLVVGSGRRRLQATTGNDTYTSTMRERLVVGP